MKARCDKWLWLVVLLIYFVLAVIRCFPIGGQLTTHFYGYAGGDLFDEMWLQRAVVLGAGHFNIGQSNTLAFPVGQDLWASHISYLHILFTFPFVLFLQWPLWWNLVVLTTIAGSSWCCWWALRKNTDWEWGAFGVGCAWLFSPWVINEAGLGHVNQICVGPIFVALAWLMEALKPGSEKAWKPWVYLVVATVVACLVYWVYGLMLAVAALAVLLCRLPTWNRSLWLRCVLAALATVVLLAPFALCVIRAQPLISNNPGEQLPGIRRGVVERARRSSIAIGAGRQPYAEGQVIEVAGSQYLCAFLLVGAIALIVLEARTRRGYGVWLLLALTFIVLCYGPQLRIGTQVLADSAGRPVELPYLYLLDSWHIFYRWSVPCRAIPVAFYFGAGFVTLAVGALGQRLAQAQAQAQVQVQVQVQAAPRLATAGKMAALLLLLVVSGGLSGWVLVCDAPRTGTTAAFIPDFCRALKDMPSGAVVDLPIGYTSNVCQLQFLHDHPLTQDISSVGDNVREHAFLQYLMLWNQLALERACQVEPGLGRYPLAVGSYTGSLSRGVRGKASVDSGPGSSSLGWRGGGVSADGPRPAGSPGPVAQQFLSPRVRDIRFVGMSRGERVGIDGVLYGTHGLNGCFLAYASSPIAGEAIPEIISVEPKDRKPLAIAKLLDDYKTNWDSGIRYVVLHRANCSWISAERGSLIYEQLCRLARTHFGPPLYRDYNNQIYAWPEPQTLATSQEWRQDAATIEKLVRR